MDLSEGWKLFCSGVNPKTLVRAEGGILTSPRLTVRVLEFIPLGEKLTMLILGLENITLAVLQVYSPNEQSVYPAFLQEVEAAIQLAAKADHFILMGDFNAHVDNDEEIWV